MLPPRAYIFFGLNAIRALSIISLVLVFASSIFVMTKDVQAFHEFQAQSNNTSLADCDYIPNSDVPNQAAGIFWAVLDRVLIMFEVIALILSEVGWPYAFFDHYFPVLGTGFGLGPLGIFQCLISAAILSHHVDDFTLVAAFFLFALGCFNMFLGLIFRERVKERRSIFSWRERAKDILPTSKLPSPLQAPTEKFVDDVFSGNWRGGVTEFGRKKKSGFGFGRQGEKQAGLKGFLISKPLETLPRYAAQPRPGTPSTSSSRSATPEPRFKSSPIAI